MYCQSPYGTVLACQHPNPGVPGSIPGPATWAERERERERGERGERGERERGERGETEEKEERERREKGERERK